MSLKNSNDTIRNRTHDLTLYVPHVYYSAHVYIIYVMVLMYVCILSFYDYV